ncbi:hypothetical protein [Agromyces sp. SYSU T00194]|uniref:hypothetical protein n=1 Tax=Agromyces chitinivorans TaxID=3158560 RepID=UPI00339A6EB6
MFAAFRAANPTEQDQFWSARAGLDSIAGAPLARADTWSWAADGIWYPNSPAWNLVLAVGWDWLGFRGLLLVAFVAICGYFALGITAARALGARALPSLLAWVPVIAASSAMLSARAPIAAQILMLGAVLLAWWWAARPAMASRIREAILVALAGLVLSLIGNWVHLSFMLWAAVIAMVWSVVWALSPGVDLRRWVSVSCGGAVGLFLGCVLSPYGIPLTLERSRVVAGVGRGLITEWQPVWEIGAVDWRGFVLAGIAVSSASVSTWWTIGVVRSGGWRSRRAALAVPIALIAVPATIAGIGTFRFLFVGMLMSLPLVAAAASDAVRRLRRSRGGSRLLSNPRMIEYTSGRFWAVIVTGVCIVLLLPVLVALRNDGRPDQAVLVADLPMGCRSFTDDRVAALIIITRPDVKVWIDGRADFYGRDHIIDTVQIYNGGQIPSGADCAILPAVYPLADKLDRSADWERFGTSAGYSAWVRHSENAANDTRD